MKIFRFTLQALLTLRLREERFATEQYAAAQLQRRQAADRVIARESELASAQKQVQQQLNSGLPAAQAVQGRAYCQSLEQRRDEAVAGLNQAERAVQACLQSMIEARRRREGVENCRDKQFKRHLRQCQQEEDRLLDELAGRRGLRSLAIPGAA